MCPSWVKMGGGFWIKDLNWTKPKCTRKTIAPKKTPGAENWRKSVNVGSWPSWPVPHKIADEKKNVFLNAGSLKNQQVSVSSISFWFREVSLSDQTIQCFERKDIWISFLRPLFFFHLSIHYANFKNRTPWKSRKKKGAPKQPTPQTWLASIMWNSLAAVSTETPIPAKFEAWTERDKE